MTLHLLNDVLLLDFTLKAAKGVFKCFTLLKFYFGQTKYTSQPDLEFLCDVFELSETLVTVVIAPSVNFLHFAQEVLIS